MYCNVKCSRTVLLQGAACVDLVRLTMYCNVKYSDTALFQSNAYTQPCWLSDDWLGRAHTAMSDTVTLRVCCNLNHIHTVLS